MIRISKRPSIRIALALGVASLCALADACWIEPNWIQVTRHTVPAAIGQRLTVAHLTDLHTRGLGFREKRLLRLLEEAKPDVIVITGDTVSAWGNHRMPLTCFPNSALLSAFGW
jgi:predicted MPP superfamily phosphohydrolase